MDVGSNSSHIKSQKAESQLVQLSEEMEENKVKNKRSKWDTNDTDKVHEFETPIKISLKGILAQLLENVDKNDKRKVISLGLGDPTSHSCFQTTHVAEQAVAEAMQSKKFNGYSPGVGLLQTRK